MALAARLPRLRVLLGFSTSWTAVNLTRGPLVNGYESEALIPVLGFLPLTYHPPSKLPVHTPADGNGAHSLK